MTAAGGIDPVFLPFFPSLVAAAERAQSHAGPTSAVSAGPGHLMGMDAHIEGKCGERSEWELF